MPDPITPRRLPKYRHYKPKDLAVVRLDGKDHYLGKFGSEESREKYRRLVASWLAGLPKAEPARCEGPDRDLTVVELTVAYLRFADRYYVKDGRPTRETTNIRLALRPLRQLYGHTKARDLGPTALKAVRQAMIESGLCRNEVNKRARIVVRVFRWAAEHELVPPSVHHGLKAVAGLKRGRSEARESAPIRPVDEALVEAVRPFVSRQVWAMIELQRLTGMRPGEVVLMRTGDLDMTGSVWAYTPRTHKTEHHGHRRVIFIGPRGQAVLRPWLRADRSAYLFQPQEALEEHWQERRRHRKTPLTPSQRARVRKGRRSRPIGDHYPTSSYCHAITNACDRAFPHPTLAQVPKVELTDGQRAELEEWRRRHRWHPHQLRHNAATWLRKEFGLEVARVILGHRSASITETYAEIDRERAINVMASVG
jgi:integrase